MSRLVPALVVEVSARVSPSVREWGQASPLVSRRVPWENSEPEAE